VSGSQVAIAWVLTQPWPLIPIVGARTEAHLRDNLGALDLELPEEVLSRLDQLSGFRPGFPREFLESDGVRELIFGNTFELIDHHRAPAARREPAPVT
jgi:hypothetical protein